MSEIRVGDRVKHADTAQERRMFGATWDDEGTVVDVYYPDTNPYPYHVVWDKRPHDTVEFRYPHTREEITHV